MEASIPPGSNWSFTGRPMSRDKIERAFGPLQEPHYYLSTGCLHGEHDYCKSNTGSNGEKVPAQCKFCKAPCTCWCHTA